MAKQKNKYVHELVDDFKKVNKSTSKSYKFHLTKITIKEAILKKAPVAKKGKKSM